MSESSLREYLLRGREVQFDYNNSRYVVKKVSFMSTDEFCFGKQWGEKYTFSTINEMLYRTYFGESLYGMLRSIGSSSIYIY